MTIIASALILATEQNHRNQTAVLLNPLPSGVFDVATGVHSGLTLTKTSGMTAQISTGRAITPHGTAADQNPYSVEVTAAETFTFADGDATRNRIDVVAIGIEGLVAKIKIIQGAYPISGNPVVPLTTAGFVALYQVPINAGMTAGSGGWTLGLAVDVRVSYAAKGGRITVSNATQRDLLPKYPGMSVWRNDLNYEETWNGSIWSAPNAPKIAFLYNSGYAINGGAVQWDVGPLTMQTTAPFSSSLVTIGGGGLGSFTINETGVYNISGISIPNTNPGAAGLFLRNVAAVRPIACAFTSGFNWETSVSTVALYAAAGAVLRFTCSATNASTWQTDIRIEQTKKL